MTTFLVATVKHPTRRSKLREEGDVLAHSLRVLAEEEMAEAPS